MKLNEASREIAFNAVQSQIKELASQRHDLVLWDTDRKGDLYVKLGQEQHYHNLTAAIEALQYCAGVISITQYDVAD